MNRSRRPPMKKAASVGSLVEGLLAHRQMDGKLREYRVWQVWDEVVGPQIAARAQPVRIREGVLEVRVEQPVWMQQLQLLKPKLLAGLNGQLEGAPIKDLFLRRGRIAEPAAPVQDPPRPPDPPLSPEERERLDQMLGEIQDAELREHLGNLLARQMRLEKGRRQKGD